MLKASDLAKFIDGEIDASIIKQEISEPVGVTRLLMKKLGSSIPVELVFDVEEFVVTKSHVKLICEKYLAGALDEVEVEYLGSALELYEGFKFDSEQVESAVFELSNSAANGPLTSDVARQILETLSS